VDQQDRRSVTVVREVEPLPRWRDDAAHDREAAEDISGSEAVNPSSEPG
jgi:hypothetical protein